ncbi:putative E3 ubiquitin-protein ligase ARI8 [Apium graveolens]|uniref:putative E3 ubiquitin-protein ligase ARI8 n=1 Tax=Apium graveolens TaxID=4045 RepID=UPI003D78FDC0
MDFSDDSYTDDDQSMYDEKSLEPMASPSFDEKAMEIKDSKTYKVLTKEDIMKNLEHDVTLLSTAISIPRSAAVVLLLIYKWNGEDAQEAWFNNEDRVCEFAGLMKRPVVESRKPGDLLVCGICFEDYVFDMNFEGTVGFCGHKFCRACLTTYISVAISDGFDCLFLRCPDPSCRAIIGEDMVNLLVSDEDKMKYIEFLFRSYVDLNNKIKWCPTADCECAIECELGSESYAVTCNCLGSVRWRCGEDSHRPIDCVTVGEWMLKNNSESQNVSWILAFTKPCPKCKSKHGYSACNGYVNRGGSEEDRNREQAKEYIMKYVHYYERWAANHKSREKALADLRDLKGDERRMENENQTNKAAYDLFEDPKLPKKYLRSPMYIREKEKMGC